MFGSCTQEISELQIILINSIGKIWPVNIPPNLDDVSRFMYEHQISMATLGGHGLGGKIALAAACHNLNRTTGYFGIDSSPMNQFYF